MPVRAQVAAVELGQLRPGEFGGFAQGLAGFAGLVQPMQRQGQDGIGLDIPVVVSTGLRQGFLGPFDCLCKVGLAIFR